MKKLLSCGLFISLIASSSVLAESQNYIEIDTGADISGLPFLMIGTAQARIGIGTHYFPSENSGWLIGLDAHVGTNIGKASIDGIFDIHEHEPTFSFISPEVAAIVGYESEKAVELTFKLGARYDYWVNAHAGTLLPQASLALGIPLSEQWKLTSEIDYRVIGASARLGLRYTFF